MNRIINLIPFLLCCLQSLAMHKDPDQNKALLITTEYLAQVTAIKKQYEDLPKGCETAADLLALHNLKLQTDRALQTNHKTTLDEQLKLLKKPTNS